MKTSLSNITNLNIPQRGRKLPLAIYEFAATVLSEYALSNLKIDSNDAVFHNISSYFAGGEILAKDFKKILGKKAVEDIAADTQLKNDMVE